MTVKKGHFRNLATSRVFHYFSILALLVWALLFGGNFHYYLIATVCGTSQGQSISSIAYGNPPPPPSQLTVCAVGSAAYVNLVESGTTHILKREPEGVDDFPFRVTPAASTVTMTASDHLGWHFIRWEYYDVNGALQTDYDYDFTITVTRNFQVTARYMKVTMSLQDGSGGYGVSNDLVLSRGAYAKANLNDTDADGCIDVDQSPVPGEVDLIRVTLNPPTPFLPGLGLFSCDDSEGPECTVWLDSNKTQQATSYTFNGESAATFYIEGTDATGTPKTVSFSYTFWPNGAPMANVASCSATASFLHYSMNVICANGDDSKSFTTLPAEDDVNCSSSFGPSQLLTLYDENTNWTITGDVEPKTAPPSASLHLLATAAQAYGGRSAPLEATIEADLTIEGINFEKKIDIEQDADDYLRQMYVDVADVPTNGSPAKHYSYVPARGSMDDVSSFSENNRGPMTFAQCRCRCTRPHSVLFCSTVASGYSNCQDKYTGGAITVTCAFRCPAHNKTMPSKVTSDHPAGNAFDFDNGSSAANWSIAKAASDAGVPKSRIRLYNAPGTSYTFQYLVDSRYGPTNFPPGWTQYSFGHVTTGG